MAGGWKVGVCAWLLSLSGCVGLPEPDGLDAAAAVPSLSCTDPCGMPIDATPGGGWEPHVAVHPDDPMHVAVASRPQGSGSLPASFVLWFDVYVTMDGGASWHVTSIRHTEPFLEGADPSAPNVVGDPVLAFLPDGTLLLTGATLQYVPLVVGGLMREVHLFTMRSPDGGFSFEEPVTVARSEGILVQASLPEPAPPLGAAALLELPDKPWITAGPDGTALITWSGFLAIHPDHPVGVRSDILFCLSRDGGRSWSAPGVVARGGSLQGSAPAIGSDGTWHVAFSDMDARRAHVAVSRDEGKTWQDREVAENAWMPALAISREAGGDRLLLAVSIPEGQGTDDAVRQIPALTWSDDGGATWADPFLLDAPQGPGRVLPSVAADGNGVAYVTFARALGEGNAAQAQFHAVALRPGEWEARLVLDGDIRGPTSRMGDYLGLAAGSRGAFAVWTTTRDGQEYDVVGGWLRAP